MTTNTPSPKIWFPFYCGDYISDTMHLTREQHGAYLFLIMHCWQNEGKIKNDKKTIKNVSQISSKKLTEILQFFREEDGYLVHKRIEKEYAKALAKKELQRKRTEAATAARWKKKDSVTDSVTDNVTRSVTYSPSPSHNSKELKENKTNVLSKKKPKEDLLEKLCLEDIQTWLDGKRANGKYHAVDEERLLEFFRDYCRANNKTYKNYQAAFRNSFEWSNAPKKGDYHAKTFNAANKAGKTEEARRAIRRGINAF
jgi:uncharacterized protein YdaU (DUF1376 family)